MEDNLSKPLYKDYKKQRAYLSYLKDAVSSRERSYMLADRPLAILGGLIIFAALIVMMIYGPGSFLPVYHTTFVLLAICSIHFVNILYVRFVFRHGRFRVTWVDKAQHPDEEASSHCDKNGEFLKTEENRIAAKKSRRAFLGLCTAIIAAVLLYFFLWIGLSYLRVPSWHSGEIEEAWKIAEKYEFVSVHDWGGVSVFGEKVNGEDISDQDSQRLWEIFNSLKWDYVSDSIIRCKDGYFEIGIHTIFGYSKLIRDENADISQVKHAFGTDTVVQLDEHWFYVRKDDARYWY